MKQFVLVVLCAVVVAACSQREDDELADVAPVAAETTGETAATPAVDSPEVATGGSAPQTTGTLNAVVTPAIGSQTNRAIFEVNTGARLENETLVQSHFGIVSGHLNADSKVRKIVFKLNSPGVDNVFPKVQLLVHTPSEKKWTELESNVVVRNEITKEYEVTGEPGRYAFRVIYNGTEPGVDTRPVLRVESVELN